MRIEAAAQAATGKTADEQALKRLRWDWGDAYRIGHNEGRGWWAQRRDGLDTAIHADYVRKAVPRDLPGDATAAGVRP